MSAIAIGPDFKYLSACALRGQLRKMGLRREETRISVTDECCLSDVRIITRPIVRAFESTPELGTYRLAANVVLDRDVNGKLSTFFEVATHISRIQWRAH